MSLLAPSKRAVKVAAFAAVYFIWGSTYLAIQLLAETLPGLSMVGVRFFIAGMILYLWARWHGVPAPSASNLRASVISGGLLLGGGTGSVVVAVEHLPSGMVALLVGTQPLWLALLMGFWPGITTRPTARVYGALLVGFAGATLLAAPGLTGGAPGVEVSLTAVSIALCACLAWTTGSLFAHTADLPASAGMTSGLQMICGGLCQILWGTLRGEWDGFAVESVSWVSVAAFFYLIFFGSLLAFSAYSWLIRTTEPTLVATHAYVNPVVAVFLGWLIASEPVGPRTVVAAALIVGSVILVNHATARPGGRRRRRRRAAPAPEQPPLEKCT
jgi:drug/metabolite transporter (DMT)-like permease